MLLQFVHFLPLVEGLRNRNTLHVTRLVYSSALFARNIASCVASYNGKRRARSIHLCYELYLWNTTRVGRMVNGVKEEEKRYLGLR